MGKCGNPFPWLNILRQEGYFSPDKNPKPEEAKDDKGHFKIVHWNVLDYLENIAIQNERIGDKNIENTLVEIIEEIISFQNDESRRIDNYITDWKVILIIFKLPIERISDRYIQYLNICFDNKFNNSLVGGEIEKTILPKLLENQAEELVLALLDLILGFKKISWERVYWLREALKKHSEGIAKLCGIKAVGIALHKMDFIIEQNKSSFDISRIRTIEDHRQNRFFDDYERQLVDFVRDVYLYIDEDNIKSEIEAILQRNHEIFKRIAFYIINVRYDSLKELFWNLRINPFEDYNLKHEVFELLKANCKFFSKDKMRKVLHWIETAKYYVDDIKEDQKLIEERKAYYKREWLLALMDTGNEEVTSLYNLYKNVYDGEISHPGFYSYTYSIKGQVSPISKVDLLSKTNEEIVEYLTNFKQENDWKKPSKEGLANCLRDSVYERPTKFSENMVLFLKIDGHYQYELFCGFLQSWREKKNFNWHNVLDYVMSLLNDREFWDKEYDDNYNYRAWIIERIAKLIEDGTKEDSWAFEKELLPQAERILLILLEKTEPKVKGLDDIVNTVLNSVSGSVLSAAVNYSLRNARVYKSDDSQRWISSMKNEFTKRLDRNFENSLEFSLTLGKYLSNLFYLDEVWVKQNIESMFLKSSAEHWEAAFTGYIFYSTSVYSSSYFLLKENGHYFRAINCGFKDEHIERRVIEHICIGYLQDWEKLDDNQSLISRVINNNVKHYEAIVNFFWTSDQDEISIYGGKIRPLWKELYKVLSKNEEMKESQKVLSDLSKWINLLDEIDTEAIDWIKLSAKYAGVNFNTTEFTDGLLKHAYNTPREVGEMFLEMLEHNHYPSYSFEGIIKLVEILYAHKQKEIADQICNKYGSQGYEFLRPVYEQYRDKDE